MEMVQQHRLGRASLSSWVLLRARNGGKTVPVPVPVELPPIPLDPDLRATLPYQLCIACGRLPLTLLLPTLSAYRDLEVGASGFFGQPAPSLSRILRGKVPLMPDAPHRPTIAGEVQPVVLVIGDFSHEGLTTKIESLGFEVINKRLRSTPGNWTRITTLIHELNAENRLAVVFVYVPTATLLWLATEQFDEVRAPLFDELARSRAILFIYEDNVQGIVEPLPWELDETDDETLAQSDLPWASLPGTSHTYAREDWLRDHAGEIQRAQGLLQDLATRGLELAPFRKRSDVTLRMFEVLDDSQAGVFLRLYVPHGRYQSEPFEDFLTVFSRYLREVEGKEFAVDTHRTARGTTYVFKGRGDATSVDDLREATKRFDAFLMLTAKDPAAAESLVKRSGVSTTDARLIVAKYARSMRRLEMEIRHEFERQSLLITQALEAELLDTEGSAPLPVPASGQPSTLFSVVGNTAPVTLNFGELSGAIEIGHLVSGHINYSEEEKEILRIIQSVADEVEALRLRSELDRLKDTATRPEERRTAIQKLKSFVYKSTKYIGSKADKVGTELLIAYLDRQMPGSS